MSDTKTILINSDFLKPVKKHKYKRKSKKKKKVPNDIQITTNALKRKLMNKIQEHQKKKQGGGDISSGESKVSTGASSFPKNISDMTQQEKQEQISFNNEFDDSLKYLQNIVNDKKRKKKEKEKEKEKEKMKQRKLRKLEQKLMNYKENKQHENIQKRHVRKIPKSPKFGILKGGRKMLYSDYKKKMMKKRIRARMASKGATNEGKNTDNNNDSIKGEQKVKEPPPFLPPTPMARSKKMKDDEFTNDKIKYGIFKNSLNSSSREPMGGLTAGSKIGSNIGSNIDDKVVVSKSEMPTKGINKQRNSDTSHFKEYFRKEYNEKIKSTDPQNTDIRPAFLGRVDSKERIKDNLKMFKEEKKKNDKSEKNDIISTPIYNELIYLGDLSNTESKENNENKESFPELLSENIGMNGDQKTSLIPTNVIHKMKKVKKNKITRIRRIYRLGRKKKDGKPTSLSIGILLPSEEVKNKINEDIKELSSHSMEKIKNELKKQNLISVGSLAPESILKTTYVNSILSGKLDNKNTERLLNNFMSVGDVGLP